MLFAFSPSGLEQNWLNPTMIEVIRSGLAAIDAGSVPEDWPTCVPAAQRTKLSSHSGFRPRLLELWDAYRGTSAARRNFIKAAIDQQTNLPEVFANDGPCGRTTGLPSKIRKAIRSLFEYMFEQLTTIKEGNQGIRDIQYAAIYGSSQGKNLPLLWIELLPCTGSASACARPLDANCALPVRWG